MQPWARRGFPGLGLRNVLIHSADTFFLPSNAFSLGLDEDGVTCPERKPSEIRRNIPPLPWSHVWRKTSVEATFANVTSASLHLGCSKNQNWSPVRACSLSFVPRKKKNKLKTYFLRWQIMALLGHKEDGGINLRLFIGPWERDVDVGWRNQSPSEEEFSLWLLEVLHASSRFVWQGARNRSQSHECIFFHTHKMQ